MDIELAKSPVADLSAARKILLLSLFCLSQFLDTFNTSALFSAIPAIATSTGLNDSQSVWLYSSYQISFAAFLLISGRMSDIYNPKLVLLSGMYLLGFSSLGIGFVRGSIAILVLRALSGIGAALSIPSSLHLLVHAFPDPVVQTKAICAFSGSGALASVLGVVIGALMISYATWPWIFYVAAILSLFTAVTCTFLVPHPYRPQHKYTQLEQIQRLDAPGGLLLMAALVLFIFAVTSGSANGWETVIVLVPLFLSVLLLGVFFAWEAQVPEDYASLCVFSVPFRFMVCNPLQISPPCLWSYPNFAPLAILALLPYAWWGTVYLIFAWYWQEVQSWSAIDSGIHFLPMGLFAIPFMALSGVLRQKFETKHILLVALFFMVAGTAFLPFAGDTSRYWFTAFPGFLLGTAGATVVFTTTNIAIFAATPPAVAGIVGAVFSCALLLGSAMISSVATSIQTSVQHSPASFEGRSAAFQFLIAFLVLEIVVVVVFVRKAGGLVVPHEPGSKALEA
ncbi:Major facilitator superfamily domain containing protein [Tylopilus felleus]